MADDPATAAKTEFDSLEPLFGGPAVYANRCFVSLGPVVRLTFMEQQQAGNIPVGPLHFRTAVTLDLAQAVALSKVMNSLLSEVEKQIREAEQGPKADATKAVEAVFKND